jgi:hypothetical protein
MRPLILILIFKLTIAGTFGQAIDISRYEITAKADSIADQFFKNDRVWRGADGAGSIDLGNGRVLWLFGDSFVSGDWTGARNGYMVRNTVGVQDGYELTAPVKYFWGAENKVRNSMFNATDKSWFWPGHGAVIDDRLVIFLFELKGVKTGLGFEAFNWQIALISNPKEAPDRWKIRYIDGPETFGVLAGSAAVLQDERYLYAFSAQGPSTNEAYLLRWRRESIYRGDLSNVEWWIDGRWSSRSTREPVPKPLFPAQTEFSVHWDAKIKKYVQVQSFGFGQASIGVRLANRLEGPWSEPTIIYKPDYTGISEPLMYSAKAHPELKNPNGVYVTYNMNADFGFVLKNQNVYFPKFLTLQIREK